MAIGTETRAKAANRPYTTPAKMTPSPRLIHRARGVGGTGGVPIFSHADTSTTPTTPRNTDMVSTSAPSASTILLSTLLIANDVAATTPGRRSASRLGAAVWDEAVNEGPAAVGTKRAAA